MNPEIQQLTNQYGPCVKVDERYLFASGAVASLDPRGAVVFRDAPTDPYLLCQIRIEHAKAILDQEEKDWDSFRHNCLEQIKLHRKNPMSCPPPPADAEAQLAAGAKRMQELRSKISKLETELGQFAAEKSKKERAERQRQLENQMRARELSILSITPF